MSDTTFLFGTLRYLPLLNLVAGRDLTTSLVAAALEDHAINTVAGADYPCLVHAKGERAEGLCLRSADTGVRDRLAFYEACFGYALESVTLANGEIADVFRPLKEPESDAVWALEAWSARWGAIALEAASEVMSRFGKEAPEEVGARFGPIRIRAASKLRAMAEVERKGAGAARPVAAVKKQSRGYDRFFAVDDLVLSHTSFDGLRELEVERAVFLMADAVTVLPYDPQRDNVLLIEQFRAGIFARGDRYSLSLEPIAGRMDPGETPEDTAHREAQEEAGVAFSRLEFISRYYPSPGGTSEYLTSYVGIADLPDSIAGISGVAEEGEDIKSHVLSFEALMSLVFGGRNANGPLVLSALWLAQNRSRLRMLANAGA